MLSRSILLAQQEFEDFQDIDGGLAAAFGIFAVFYLAVLALMLIALWMVFSKAGEPRWAAIVPIYNVIVLLKVAGKPWWWIVLLLIPIVNLILGIIIAIDLARNFGKGGGFAVGLIFLPFIFYPILGFGSARYQPQTA